jgi:mannose/fructose/N-acetylgalactosamine-specific phosphotransferase system component IIB
LPIVLVRVDDRLIHGQITTAWIAHTRATRIAISSDKVAGDSLQKTIIDVTKPPKIAVDVLTAEETIRSASSGEWDRERVFVICKYPGDALKLVKAGLGIDEINVGNVGGMTQLGSDARKQVHKSIAVTQADVKLFREILSDGVALEIRVIPQDRRIDMATLLGKL